MLIVEIKKKQKGNKFDLRMVELGVAMTASTSADNGCFVESEDKIEIAYVFLISVPSV